MITTAVLLCLLLSAVVVVNATHFRFGELTWVVLPSPPNTVQLTLITGWRSEYYFGPNPSVPGLVSTPGANASVGALVSLAGGSNFGLCFGDEVPSVPVTVPTLDVGSSCVGSLTNATVTFVDSANDYFLCSLTRTHTYSIAAPPVALWRTTQIVGD